MQKNKIPLFFLILFVVLLNLLVGIWLLTDWFDTSDTPIAGTEESTAGQTKTVEVSTDIPKTERPNTEEDSTAEPSTEAPEPVTVELSPEQAKREIVVLYPGEGEGQVGYYENTSPAGNGNGGPESFAVVNGKVYVLDSVNGRILCYADGRYSEIKIPDGVEYMQYMGEQLLLVTTGTTKPLQFYVYDLDGTEKLSVSLPEAISGVNEILMLNDTSVEFDGRSQTGRSIIKFDWETQKYSRRGSVSSLEQRIDMAVRSEYAFCEVIAEVNDDLFYVCCDSELNHFVNRQSADGSRWFVKLDEEPRYSTPNQQFYLDADGRLYAMECFDDRTVISELVLGER